MSCNTFFGEVNELNSRAIYWSDSESDEESPVDTEVNVVLRLTDAFNTDCLIIYISLAKNDKTIAGKQLTSIGSAKSHSEDKTSIADIFTINETSIWIRLNANHTNLKNHLLVKTISSLMKQIVAKCKISSENKPLVSIISKDFLREDSSDNVITYLTSNQNNLNIIGSELKSRPLLAPKMLNNLIESSVFEYCLVFDINCISIILPEMLSMPLKEAFIPKTIIDSLKQFNQFSDSNIYI